MVPTNCCYKYTHVHVSYVLTNPLIFKNKLTCTITHVSSPPPSPSPLNKVVAKGWCWPRNIYVLTYFCCSTSSYATQESMERLHTKRGGTNSESCHYLSLLHISADYRFITWKISQDIAESLIVCMYRIACARTLEVESIKVTSEKKPNH